MAKSRMRRKTLQKPKTKRTIKPKIDKKSADKAGKEEDVLDEDAVFKEFFTGNVRPILAIVKPALEAAIDWSVPFIFCEQELINTLSGRLRQKGKRKIADKLLKVKLLNGEDHYIFIHNEFQNELTDELAFRWFKTRMLISLRYGVERITTIIFFTGNAPLEKHWSYKVDCFGTKTTFEPNIFVFVTQNEQELMDANDPISLAFLAAKYAVDSKDDMVKRWQLKKKVFDLFEKQGFSLEDNQTIINFVFDCMLLPKDMEDELKLTIPFIFPPIKKDEEMLITPNSVDVLNAVSYKKSGMNFLKYDALKEAEIAALKAEVAAKDAEVAAKDAALKAEKEAALKDQVATIEARVVAIHGMLQIDFSIEKIADIMGFNVSYVKELAEMKPKSVK